METNEITAALDQLSGLQSMMDAKNLEKQELIDKVLTPEIKQILKDIEDEYSFLMEPARAEMAALENQIREAVTENGASVKGAHLHAVYSKGRVTWDGQLLEGLMIAIPALEKARKVGAPSVSIRHI